jgi:hypothetical protein
VRARRGIVRRRGGGVAAVASRRGDRRRRRRAGRGRREGRRSLGRGRRRLRGRGRPPAGGGRWSSIARGGRRRGVLRPRLRTACIARGGHGRRVGSSVGAPRQGSPRRRREVATTDIGRGGGEGASRRLGGAWPGRPGRQWGRTCLTGGSGGRARRPRGLDVEVDARRGGVGDGRREVGREYAIDRRRRGRFEDAAGAGADRAGLLATRADPGEVWGHHPAASRYHRRLVALMARMSASDHP